MRGVIRYMVLSALLFVGVGYTAQQVVDRGTIEGDQTGDSLWEIWGKVNNNDTELYGASVGAGEGLTGGGATVTGVILDAATKNSIEIDSDYFQLVGDVATPGNTKLYGTNASGDRGWYDQSLAEVNNLEVVVTGIAADEIPVGSGANIATYTGTTGTGTVVRSGSPTITTPYIGTIIGSTALGGDIKLYTTSHATKGNYYMPDFIEDGFLKVSVSTGIVATTTIRSGEIEDSTIQEIDLYATNSPTDNYLLSYDLTTGGFTWVDSSGGITDHGALTGLSDDDHSQYLLLAGRSGGQVVVGGTGSGDDITFQTTSDGTKGSYIFSELTTNGVVKTSGASGTLVVDALLDSTDIENDSLLAVDLDVTNSPTDNYVLSYDLATGGFTWIATGGGVSDHGALTGLSDDDHTIYALLAGRSGGQTIIGGTAAGDDLTLQTTSSGTKGSYILSELTSNGFVRTNSGTGALSVDTSIDTADILDATILAADINATNAPTDNYLLSYNAAGGNATWIEETWLTSEVNNLETLTTGILDGEVPVGTGTNTVTYVDTTGSGNVVRWGSPTITTPFIASFLNSGHDHEDAAGGGKLDHTLALTNVGTNTHNEIDTHIADLDIHVDHTAVTLTAGDGLSGTGDISASLTFAVQAKNSIEVNADFLQLVGDTATPGNSKLYGTNAAGARGWYDQGSLSESNNLESITSGIGIGEVPLGTSSGIATYTGTTGSGVIVRTTSPTIVTPTIASFTNATHNHQTAAGGGTLTLAAITDDGALASLDTVGTVQIDDDSVMEIDLDVTNTPTDNYILSYDATSGGFTWVTQAAGVDWTVDQGATNIHPGNYTDTDTQLSQEQVDDFVYSLINDDDSVHTRITINYDDSSDAYDFVVDDMNDDQPDNDGEVPDAITVDPINAATENAIEAVVDHDDLVGFVANEHIDWSIDQGATNIDPGNYDDTNTQLSQEQVDDFVAALVNDADSLHSRITINYDDASNAYDFIVDDMNDDVPEVGDFGNALALNADGSITDATVFEDDLYNFTTASDDKLMGFATATGQFQWTQVREPYLVVSNSPTDNYVLSYNSATTGFTWVPDADTDTQLTDEQVEDIIGAMLVGTETGIDVSYDDVAGEIDFVVTASGGEANTASNVGSGVGVWERKSSLDLQFNSLVSQSSALTISEDDANDEIDFTITTANSIVSSGGSIRLVGDSTTPTPGANMKYGTHPTVPGIRGWYADDDVPESGDFGAAGDLDADGSITDGNVVEADLNIVSGSAVDGKILASNGSTGFKWVDDAGGGPDDDTPDAADNDFADGVHLDGDGSISTDSVGPAELDDTNNPSRDNILLSYNSSGTDLEWGGDIVTDGRLHLAYNSLNSEPAVVMDESPGHPSVGSSQAAIYAHDGDGGYTWGYAKNSNGDTTQITPHDADGEWIFYSFNTRTGRRVRVEMEQLMRWVAEKYAEEKGIDLETVFEFTPPTAG